MLGLKTGNAPELFPDDHVATNKHAPAGLNTQWLMRNLRTKRSAA